MAWKDNDFRHGGSLAVWQPGSLAVMPHPALLVEGTSSSPLGQLTSPCSGDCQTLYACRDQRPWCHWAGSPGPGTHGAGRLASMTSPNMAERLERGEVVYYPQCP